MSRFHDLIINNPLCCTKEMIDFVDEIELSLKNYPEEIQKLMDKKLLSVFEKGLVLGLHHFNDGDDECEE